MRTYLRHDSETGELMLVMADYWEGQHEETAYHVVNSDNRPVRNRQDMDGQRVYGHAGARYVKAPSGHGEIPVRTMPGERVMSVKTPCPRATNRRRKCALCTD